MTASGTFLCVLLTLYFKRCSAWMNSIWLRTCPLGECQMVVGPTKHCIAKAGTGQNDTVALNKFQQPDTSVVEFPNAKSSHFLSYSYHIKQLIEHDLAFRSLCGKGMYFVGTLLR